MKKFIIAFIILFSVNVHSNEIDDALQTAMNALLVADWGTTRNITHRYDEGYYEKYNKILDKHPSTEKVDCYFGAVIGASNYFIPKLDTRHRRIVYVTIIVLELAMVQNNHQIGLKIDF